MTLRLHREGMRLAPEFIFHPPAAMTPEMADALASISIPYIFNPYLSGREASDRFHPAAGSMIGKYARRFARAEPRDPDPCTPRHAEATLSPPSPCACRCSTYSIIDLLGHGTFAHVYRASSIATGLRSLRALAVESLVNSNVHSPRRRGLQPRCSSLRLAILAHVRSQRSCLRAPSTAIVSSEPIAKRMQPQRRHHLQGTALAAAHAPLLAGLAIAFPVVALAAKRRTPSENNCTSSQLPRKEHEVLDCSAAAMGGGGAGQLSGKSPGSCLQWGLKSRRSQFDSGNCRFSVCAAAPQPRNQPPHPAPVSP